MIPLCECRKKPPGTGFCVGRKYIFSHTISGIRVFREIDDFKDYDEVFFHLYFKKINA